MLLIPSRLVHALLYPSLYDFLFEAHILCKI